MVIEPMKPKEAEVPVEWLVEVKIQGRGWLTVMASNKEEAEEKAWEAYHSGIELEQLEWEADDVYPQKVK